MLVPVCCLAVAARALRKRSTLKRRSRGGEVENASTATAVIVPKNLYQLLGVRRAAMQDDIKMAYRQKQKISHPDIAGERSSELCILLNDAYQLLRDPQQRELYDENQRRLQDAGRQEEVTRDLGPTWKWTPKSRRDSPLWLGTPRSRSQWDKLPEEDRGEKWVQQLFTYVDPFLCVACRNCYDAAPKTFMMDIKNGKARVYAQWGDAELGIDYAIDACPVECISWVSREELQCLEYVTAKHLDETNHQMACAMQIRQGTIANPNDPFQWAEDFKRHLNSKEVLERDDKLKQISKQADKLAERIRQVFQHMPLSLKLLGWSSVALPTGRS